VSATLCTIGGRVEISSEVAERLPAPSVWDVAILWSRMVPAPEVGSVVKLEDGQELRVLAVELNVLLAPEGNGTGLRWRRHVVVATMKDMPPVAPSYPISVGGSWRASAASDSDNSVIMASPEPGGRDG
jgi:hypothetical protein